MIQNEYSYGYTVKKIYPSKIWYPEETAAQMGRRLRNEWLQSIAKKKKKK